MSNLGKSAQFSLLGLSTLETDWKALGDAKSGALIGSLEDGSKGHVVELTRFVPAPLDEASANKGPDASWLALHASQLVRLLPAPLTVVGFWATTKTSNTAIGPLQLAAKAYLKSKEIGVPNAVALIIGDVEAPLKKWNVSVSYVDSSDLKSVSNVSATTTSNNSVSKFDNLIIASYPFTISAFLENGVSLIDVLKSAIEKETEAINSSKIVINGQLLSSSDSLSLSSPITNASFLKSFGKLSSILGTEKYDSSAVMTLSGTINAVTFGSSSSKAVERALKDDVKRSLSSRINLWLEAFQEVQSFEDVKALGVEGVKSPKDLLAFSTNGGAAKVSFNLPNRTFLKLKDSNMIIGDYLMPIEDVDAAIERCSALLGVSADTLVKASSVPSEVSTTTKPITNKASSRKDKKIHAGELIQQMASAQPKESAHASTLMMIGAALLLMVAVMWALALRR